MCIKVCIPSSARTTTPLIILTKDTSEWITLSIPHTLWTWRSLSSPSCAPSSRLLFFFATFASGTATLVRHMSHGWLFWVLAVLCASLIFCVSFKKTTSSLFQRLMKYFLSIDSRRLEIPHLFSVNLWLWARQKMVCLIQGRRDFPRGHGNDERVLRDNDGSRVWLQLVKPTNSWSCSGQSVSGGCYFMRQKTNIPVSFSRRVFLATLSSDPRERRSEKEFCIEGWTSSLLPVFFCHATSCLCMWHCVFVFYYQNAKQLGAPPLLTVFGSESNLCRRVSALRWRTKNGRRTQLEAR